MNNILRLLGRVAEGTIGSLATNVAADRIQKSIKHGVIFWQSSESKEPIYNNNPSPTPK